MRTRTFQVGMGLAVLAAVGLSLVIGYHIGTGSMQAGKATAGGAADKKIRYWDPMLGPSSISDKPGISAMGMQLVPYDGGDSATSNSAEVHIDSAMVQNMGIRTTQVSRGPLGKTVRTVGMLEVPESAQYEINLRVNGWIKKLYADQVGMHVHKGEPLFDLYSPDLLVAEDELIGAIKSLKSLDPKASDALRSESQSMIDSAKQKLRQWDVADSDIDSVAQATTAPDTIPFRSPADGTVLEKMVVQGSSVQAGMKVMRIEDHARLWLEAQVYAVDLPLVALGQRVEATVDGVPGKTFTGPISFVYPHLDHMTRTAMVRVSFDNPNHELSPGMYVVANIVTEPVPDAVWVPRESVIDTGERQIAIVALPQGHFEPRKVLMGMMGDDDRVQILEGLSPGETVVTSGQFLIDVESRTNEAFDKMKSGQSTVDAPAAIDGTAIRDLFIAHCTMTNADWLQADETIVNPYLGAAMSTCGSITRTVLRPDRATPLAGLVDAYLKVSKSLAADQIDPSTLAAVKSTADEVTGDKYTSVRESAAQLSRADSVALARIRFKWLGDELIQVLPPAGP